MAGLGRPLGVSASAHLSETVVIEHRVIGLFTGYGHRAVVSLEGESGTSSVSLYGGRGEWVRLRDELSAVIASLEEAAGGV